MLAVKSLVCDVNAAERRLEFGPKAQRLDRFARTQEGDFAFPQFTRDVAKGRGRIAVTHIVQVATRGEMHANQTRSPYRQNGVRHFEQEPARFSTEPP